MDIILREDIKGLGYKHDIVAVKPGFGRNFLIPQGKALLATPSAKKVREENIRQASHKADKIKLDAQTMAEKIGDLVLTIETKAGESGKIFGAVTTTQLAEALNEKGFEIDKKKLTVKGEVKAVGEYVVELDLHRDVQHEVKFNVVAI